MSLLIHLFLGSRPRSSGKVNVIFLILRVSPTAPTGTSALARPEAEKEPSPQGIESRVGAVGKLRRGASGTRQDSLAYQSHRKGIPGISCQGSGLLQYIINIPGREIPLE